MTFSVDNRFLRRTIEKALKDLPALPAVVTRILQETEQPDASAASVEKLLASDQALTMKVLRVVNSAYYGLSGQVTSLGQAVVILGMQQVRNLVLSVGAISSLPIKTPRQQETLKQFWLHSFGSAAAAQIIAKEKRQSARDIEIAFLGGLLHDIGRLFLFANFTEIYDNLIAYAAQRQITIEDAELAFLGMTHGQVGEEMAKAWKLPPLLCSLIAHHEGPFTEESTPLEFTVHLADYLTKHLYQLGDTGQAIAPDEHALEWLAMSDEQFQELREVTEIKIEEAVQVFGMMAAA